MPKNIEFICSLNKISIRHQEIQNDEKEIVQRVVYSTKTSKVLCDYDTLNILDSQIADFIFSNKDDRSFIPRTFRRAVFDTGLNCDAKILIDMGLLPAETYNFKIVIEKIEVLSDGDTAAFCLIFDFIHTQDKEAQDIVKVVGNICEFSLSIRDLTDVVFNYFDIN